MKVEITRYGSRNWAVWCEGELLAVTLYRKGALAVAEKINQLTLNHETPAICEDSFTQRKTPTPLPCIAA